MCVGVRVARIEPLDLYLLLHSLTTCSCRHRSLLHLARACHRFQEYLRLRYQLPQDAEGLALFLL
jgi:hypothetical protein